MIARPVGKPVAGAIILGRHTGRDGSLDLDIIVEIVVICRQTKLVLPPLHDISSGRVSPHDSSRWLHRATDSVIEHIESGYVTEAVVDYRNG